MNHPLVAVRHGARRAPVIRISDFLEPGSSNSKLKTQNSQLSTLNS